MQCYIARVSGAVAIGIVLLLASGWPTNAQDRIKPPKHLKRQRMVFDVPERAPRGLTVTKRFAHPARDGGGFEPDLVGEDEGEVYGDIAGFNPSPYVTSGVQLPYGLDGVGGYGSDLGFGAAADDAIYQR